MRDVLAVLAAGALFAGCGAAYYGTAIAIFVTQKKTTNVDTSFPDSVPTVPEVPAFATVAFSGAQATVERSGTGGFVVAGTPQVNQVTDLAVTGLNFPAGLGEARSNRDANQTLVVGDKLFLRLNGDGVQTITIAAGETATIGSAVAAAIQSKVRVLAPQTAGVPATAYTLFTASFDQTSGSYLFQSGAPGETSEVVWQPVPRANTTDPEPDAPSQQTATRLGLGLANGGIETSGAEALRFQVLNRGDDVIPAGTKVRLYLSLDKDLSLADDIPFSEVEIPETIAVGESRRVSRRNTSLPPVPLIKGDFRDTSYYVLISVEETGGEQVTTNNVTASLGRVQIYQPVDDPATSAAETALALDFVPTRCTTPIALLAGNDLAATIAVTNLGEVVPAAGAALDLDVVLSADTTFDAPAGFQDPAGTLAGIRINPRNPNRSIRVVVNKAGAGALTATVFADTITVAYNSAAGTATVQSMIAALNASTGSLVEAFHDGRGSTTELLDPLITAAGVTEQTAKDLFVTTKRVTFTQTSRPQEERSFRVDGTVRNAFDSTALPVKLRPFVRVRPVVSQVGGVNENTKNNVRQGRNFIRVYSRTTATFDADTGVSLPTRTATDFAKLDAVSQRPVNTGAITQGQQRVFSFSLPSTGAPAEESQLLVVVRSNDFDAHLDLYSGTGEFLAGNDDIGLGRDPVVYSPALAAGANRTFYLVVSPARFDEADLSGGDETFELTISVNSRQLADPGLLTSTKGDNVLSNLTQRYEPPASAARTRNNVLLPYALTNRRAEVMFVLPQRARVRFRSTPIANSGITTTITEFLLGQVPSPVEFQAEFDPAASKIVYRPLGKGANASHLLAAGVYTVAFDGSLTDTQKFRLEVDTEFVPDSVTDN